MNSAEETNNRLKKEMHSAEETINRLKKENKEQDIKMKEQEKKV